MKRILLLLACAGTLSLLAYSCTEDPDNPNNEVEQEEIVIPVEIKDVASSEVGSLAVLDIEENGTVNSDAQGDLELSIPAEGDVSVKAKLADTPVAVPGELLLKSNDDVPAVCQSESGAQFASAKIVLTLENPADEPVIYTGVIEAGGITVDMPEILVPADTKAHKVILMDKPGDTPNGIQLPAPIIDKVNRLGQDAIKIKDVYVSKATRTRGDDEVSGTYSFSVAAIYVAPLVFPKGTIIDFDIVLDDLGSVNPSEYVGNSKEYELKCTVINSLPFQISGTGETPTGVKAELVDKNGKNIKIAPGDTNKPVSTDVIVHFVCTGGLNAFESATIHLKLEALETATLNKNQKIEVSYNGITYHMQA